MKIVTVGTLKGGTGKTTLVINLADGLRRAGKRVLVIDSDSNNSLSDFYASRIENEAILAKNLYHVILRQKKFAEVIHQGAHGHDIVPCTPDLGDAEIKMLGRPAAILGMRNGLLELNYDFILIDTPPHLTYSTQAALHSCDVVLSPVAPWRWIIQGMQLLSKEIKAVGETLGKAPKHIAVPYMVSKTDEEIIDKYLDQLRIPKTKTKIPRKSELRTKTDKGQLLKPGSSSALLFDALAKEIT